MKIHYEELEFEELFELAKPEIKAIVDYFPIEKIREVLVTYIDGGNVEECIYGRLTGNCDSEESRKFIKNHINDLFFSNGSHGIDIDEAFDDRFRTIYYMTALESYIYPNQNEIEFYYENDYYLESYSIRVEKVKDYIKKLILNFKK